VAAAPLIVVSGPSGVGKTTVGCLVAAGFERSAHLDADDFMVSIVRGWIDPSLPDAAPQHQAVGGALAGAAFGFAEQGYTTVVSGHLFPEGVQGLAVGCAARGVPCHYAVLTADLETCRARATARGERRWPLVSDAFAQQHERFARLDVDQRHVLDATASPAVVTDAVLAAFRAGRLVVEPPTGGRSTR
jgi:predicted kinase